MKDEDSRPDDKPIVQIEPGEIRQTRTGAMGRVLGPPLAMIPPEIAGKLAPEDVRTLELQMQIIAPAVDPLAAHYTTEHVDRLIANADSASVRLDSQLRDKRRDDRHARITNSVLAVGLLMVLAAVWSYMPANRLDSFREIAKALVILAAGGVGGYGLAIKNLRGEE